MVLDEWVVDAAATHHLSLPELITRLSHHPQVDSFLALWQQCLSVSDRTDKMELYRQLCAQVTDPGRVLWPDDHTVFELHSVTPASLEQIEVALDFWADLITGKIMKYTSKEFTEFIRLGLLSNIFSVDEVHHKLNMLVEQNEAPDIFIIEAVMSHDKESILQYLSQVTGTYNPIAVECLMASELLDRYSQQGISHYLCSFSCPRQKFTAETQRAQSFFQFFLCVLGVSAVQIQKVQT